MQRSRYPSDLSWWDILCISSPIVFSNKQSQNTRDSKFCVFTEMSLQFAPPMLSYRIYFYQDYVEILLKCLPLTLIESSSIISTFSFALTINMLHLSASGNHWQLPIKHVEIVFSFPESCGHRRSVLPIARDLLLLQIRWWGSHDFA